MTIPLSATNQGGAIDEDYSGVPASVTFSATETEKSFAFTATDDYDNDNGESVKLAFGTLPDQVSAGSTNETTVSIADNDDPQVTVSFDQSAYDVDEADDTNTGDIAENEVTVTVTLSADPERTVTISLIKTNQGGASDTDYSGVPASLTFATTETEKTFTFSATDDADNDDGESVKLAFGSLPAGVTAGSTSEATVSIADNDEPQQNNDPPNLNPLNPPPDTVLVSFTSGGVFVEEGRTATISLRLSEAAAGAVTIPLSTANQGGASNADYSGVPASVTFSGGETSRSFSFRATDDTEDDDGESVKLTFGSMPTGVSPGPASEVTVSINDNDGPQQGNVPSNNNPVPPPVDSVQVSFSSAGLFLSEGDTETITLRLGEAMGGAVTIPLTTAERGGASNADYSHVPNNVTFSAGATETSFTFTAERDADNDDGESVNIAFGRLPNGVIAGSPSDTTIVILDVPSVFYDAPKYSAVEGGQDAEVTLRLSEPLTRAVTIPLTTKTAGDTSPGDWTGVPDDVTFPEGETAKSFNVVAVDDMEKDKYEEVVLGLGMLPPGLGGGQPNTARVILLDTGLESTISCTGDEIWCATIPLESRFTPPLFEVFNPVTFNRDLPAWTDLDKTFTFGGNTYEFSSVYVNPQSRPDWTTLTLSFSQDEDLSPPSEAHTQQWRLFIEDIELGFGEDAGASRIGDATYSWQGADFYGFARIGKKITVRIVRDDGTTTEYTPDEENEPPTGELLILGEATIGNTLSLDISGISDPEGMTTSSIQYWWGTIDGNHRGFAHNGPDYTVVRDDAGKNIVARISFTDDAGKREVVSSAPSPVVPPDSSITTNLRARSNDDGSITLTWDAPEDDSLVSYQISRNPTADGADQMGVYVVDTQTDATTFTDTDVTEGEMCTYFVAAVFADSTLGLPSNTVSAVSVVRTGSRSEETESDKSSKSQEDTYSDKSTKSQEDTESDKNTESQEDTDSDKNTESQEDTDSDKSTESQEDTDSDKSTESQEDTDSDKSTESQEDTDSDKSTESQEDTESKEQTEEEEEPLTAEFVAAPSSHDGETAFTFELHFSEEFSLSYRTLRDHAFTIAGGEITEARRLNKPSNLQWLITVEADGAGDVTIILPTTEDCEQDGAICTEDGKRLSVKNEITVSGPGE